jgi:hypothetical protein
MSVATVTTGPVLKRVQQLNGQRLEVQGDAEAQYYREQQKKYLSENRFTAASDLADLDRLLFLELLDFRWRLWLASGKDYDGFLTPNQEDQLRKNLKENSPLISQIKNDLGLTKSARDKESAESVGAYIVELKKRAKEHGIRREKQLTRAICLVQELSSLLGTYDRSNQLERSKIGLDTPEDILDWIRTSMLPQFAEVDAYFRAHHQKFWVGKV